MTDQISFPPLLDLSPGELEAHKQHLVREIAQQPRAARRLPLRFPATNRGRIVGIAAIAGASALIAFLALPGASSQHSGTRVQGNASPHRITLPPATPVTLSKAQSDTLNSFGVPLILPNTSVLKPSDTPTALEQWCVKPPEAPTTALCQMNVQFASPAVSIEYVLTSHTFGSTYANALDQYRAEIARATDPSEYQTADLSGTPALIKTGKTGNSIEFRLGKLSITIWAPNSNGVPTSVDGAKLQALAQSIIDRASGQ